MMVGVWLIVRASGRGRGAPFITDLGTMSSARTDGREPQGELDARVQLDAAESKQLFSRARLQACHAWRRAGHESTAGVDSRANSQRSHGASRQLDAVAG